MPFPEAVRVVYERNPLAEVIAQLRFAPILGIDGSPADFQNGIRGEYPTYRLLPAMPAGVPQPVQRVIRELGAPEGIRQHVFGSQNGQWEIILTRESLVLKTRLYGGWEDFSKRIDHVQGVFERTYRPANNYTSVNLRYIDIIQRSRLDLQNEHWSNLLVAAIAGELASAEIGRNIDKMSRMLHCRLDDQGSFVTLKTGLVVAQNTNEQSFLIDSDFHTHRSIGVQDVRTTFQRFNQHSRNLFQWAITERLRNALRPVPRG